MGNVNFHNLLREESYPTYYKEVVPKILIDVNLFRICALFLSAFIAFLIVLPGFRRNKKFFVVSRWTTSISIMFFIIYCNIMPYWEYGSVTTRMPYRFGSNLYINASLGIKIGLRGINVTLTGNPVRQNRDLIDFNEHFDWTWSQGKPGYGENVGHFRKDYRKAQARGLPYPILWVAETFTIDYEQIRIGRYYRQSGWFAHVFLWTAMPLFILANILFQTVVYYGSLFIIFTGISLLSANFVVMYLRSSIPFTLAFDDDQFLVTHYSWCFYMNLVNGVVCIIIGIITLIADLRMPDEIAEFFGNDVLQSYEDYFADPQEKNGDQDDEFSQIHSKSDNEVLLRKKTSNNNNATPSKTITSGLRKRTLNERFSRFQKSTIRKTVQKTTDIESHDDGDLQETPKPKQPNEEMPLYENFNHQFSVIGEETCENEMSSL